MNPIPGELYLVDLGMVGKVEKLIRRLGRISAVQLDQVKMALRCRP